MTKLTATPNVAWIEPQDKRQIVISSRLRLARNLAGRAFPNRLSDKQAATLGREVLAAIKAAAPEENWEEVALDELFEREKGVLLEKHLLSPDILQHTPGRYLAVNGEESLAVMVNEEDHLRIQAILPGLQTEAAWAKLSDLEDRLAERLDFAYDERLGYLTACPTNLGTGLRASVMLHLPALEMTDKLTGIFRQLPQAGFVVRGVYGEGSDSVGSLYQVSNQVTLGFAEEEIILRLNQLVEQIVAQELQAREWLMANRELWLRDKIGRACGILGGAYMLSSKEAMAELSLVRLGVAMGLVNAPDYRRLNLLMLNLQAAFLQTASGRELTAAERDEARAKLTRQEFRM